MVLTACRLTARSDLTRLRTRCQQSQATVACTSLPRFRRRSSAIYWSFIQRATKSSLVENPWITCMILTTCSGSQPIYCSPVAPIFAVIVILPKSSMPSTVWAMNLGVTLTFHGPSRCSMIVQPCRKTFIAGFRYWVNFAASTEPSSSMNIRTPTLPTTVCSPDFGDAVAIILTTPLARSEHGTQPFASWVI